MSRWDIAFDRVISHEGGFTNDRRDRGNWTSGKIGVGELKGTKYGIASHAYPTLDIKNLTREQAKAIYKRDYWDKAQADALPPGLDFQVFDAAVNHGLRTAVSLLQRTVGTNDDGVLGPKTLAAAQKASPYAAALYLEHRLRYYTDLSTFSTYGRGWVRRVADNLAHAYKDMLHP